MAAAEAAPLPASYDANQLHKEWFGGFFPKRKCKPVPDLLAHSQRAVPSGSSSARFVCISDIHHPKRIREERIPWKFPEGDALLVAGDLTLHGSRREVSATAEWLGRLPYQHKVVIAGNHDFCLDPDDESYSEAAEAELRSVCTYLRDCETELFDCVRVFGSPVTPEFHSMAFNVERGPSIRRVWRQIPDAVDLLLTHGPPLGHGDLVINGIRAGCADLLLEVEQRVRPAYHIFGHIHEAYGASTDGRTVFVNAASCNLRYFLENAPLVFDLPLRRPQPAA